MRTNKIFVMCPGESVSGGPELLHQLVFTLRKLGKEAYICYYPFETIFECPQPYEIYRCPQAVVEDKEDNLVVIPEVATKYAARYRKSMIGVFWLSVDNYFGYRQESAVNGCRHFIKILKPVWLRNTKSYIEGTLRLYRLRKCFHFCQSAYAASFLSRRNFTFDYLTDYLNASHFEEGSVNGAREDIVVYNTQKGAARTKRLIEDNPNIRFVAVQNMSAAEVRRTMLRAKIYVDLGPHPGKDRLPREAAMAGCCVITGRRGSAGFHEDVPIPGKYKLYDNSAGYSRAFGELAREVFLRFDEHSRDFDVYRAIIASEEVNFQRQVKDIFISA
jgi:hypothetical protein